MRELETQGYSIVNNVVPADECDTYILQYKQWMQKFGDDRPYRDESLIHHFRVAHSEPTWYVRLKSKPVFAELWKTDKVLTSMDGVAIEEPPELGTNIERIRVMVLNATFNNISVISWRSVSLVEKTRVS